MSRVRAYRRRSCSRGMGSARCCRGPQRSPPSSLWTAYVHVVFLFLVWNWLIIYKTKDSVRWARLVALNQTHPLDITGVLSSPPTCRPTWRGLCVRARGSWAARRRARRGPSEALARPPVAGARAARWALAAGRTRWAAGAAAIRSRTLRTGARAGRAASRWHLHCRSFSRCRAMESGRSLCRSRCHWLRQSVKRLMLLLLWWLLLLLHPSVRQSSRVCFPARQSTEIVPTRILECRHSLCSVTVQIYMGCCVLVEVRNLFYQWFTIQSFNGNLKIWTL